MGTDTMHHSRSRRPIPSPTARGSSAPRRRWRRLPRRLAAALLLAALVAACGSPEEKEARHLERGVAHVEAGDDARALVEFQNVLRLNPKNADALYHAGLIHERAGQLPQAYAAYQQAAAERPGFVAANVRAGTLALTDGALDAAEGAAEAIERAEPGNPDALAIRGSIALRRGETQAALDLATRALEAAPQHENAVAVLVGVHHRLGEHGRALARLDEALAANPESVPLRVLKTMLLEEAEDIDVEALTSTYEELFALQPENAAYPLALADFHQRRGDVARAEAVLRTAIRDGSRAPRAVGELVRLVHRERGFEAAVAELEGLIGRDPDDHALRFLLADLYASGGRPEDAEEVLAGIVARVEGSGQEADDARAAMARIRLAAGDKEGARELAAGVLAGNEGHRTANLVLGSILLDEGRVDDAIRSARSALREESSWLPGLRLVAEAHLRKGETSLALDVLRQVVSLDPNDVRSAERLAQLLTEGGDYGAALRVWDQVVRAGDDPAPALRARAEIEIRRGNYSAAQADIERLLGLPGWELTGALLAGDLMLAQRRFDEAREWFARAAALDPEAPQPVLGLARSHTAEGDADGARAYLEQRTRERPDDAVAFELMGGLLAQMGEPDRAEAALREAIRLRPDWLDPYRRLGRLLREGGDAAEAIEVYRAALERQPGDPNVLNELAYTSYAAGRFADAADTYDRLLRLAPNLDMAAYNYAAIVAGFLHGDPERLERALDLAAARFRASSDPNQLDVLGWLHYHKGDHATAASFLERAVGLDPDQPEFRYHLGMALHRSGQKERALAELARAVADEGADYPGLDEARATYAELRQELGAADGGAGIAAGGGREG